tara:strand:+ start:124 stop:360 length:237 start_codon:yes stop_codon:yes gene_type:complete
MMFASKSRSLIKTISWRIVGTLDTMFLGWIITGSPLVGLKIGALELITKFVLYYLHERAWVKCKYGIDKKVKKVIENK